VAAFSGLDCLPGHTGRQEVYQSAVLNCSCQSSFLLGATTFFYFPCLPGTSVATIPQSVNTGARSTVTKPLLSSFSTIELFFALTKSHVRITRFLFSLFSQSQASSFAPRQHLIISPFGLALDLPLLVRFSFGSSDQA